MCYNTRMKINVCKKVAISVFMFSFAVAAYAGGAHGDPQGWFDEDYSGLNKTSSVKWSTDAGSWTKQDAGDDSTVTSEGVTLETNDRELKFAAKAKSATDSLVRVTGRMTFSACAAGDEYWVTNSVPQASLSMRLTNGVPVFIGWRTTRDTSLVKGYWTELSAPGVVAVNGGEYAFAIDMDYSCSPTRVRYSVNGVPLADARGESWFSIKSATKRASSVGFWGHGEVGELAGTAASPRTERATVSFGKLARPKAGDEVTFSSVSTNEGCALSGELVYRWYRTDAAGMRSDEATGEGTSYAVTAADYGHWVTVEVSDDAGYAGSGRFWCSELPVFYIDVENGAFPSEAKETHDATLFVSAAKKDGTGYDGAITIHVRGNSTAGGDKKPYKLKLDKKTNLLDLCRKTDEKGKEIKSKHWVLLANFYDESLMRNKLAYDLSGAYGLVPMESTWVDVVINGRFDGCYQLCQHIRVAEERLNIYDWSDAAGTIAEKALEANPSLTEDDQDAIEDLLEVDCGWMTTGAFAYLGTNYTVKAKGTAGVTDDGVTVVWKKFSTDISGGYVFELDSKKTKCEHGAAGSQAVCSFVQTNKTDYGTLRLHLAMNTPEYAFTNPDVEAKVRDIWWNIGRAALSGNGCDTNGVHYTELCDLDSLVGYWLAEYVPANLSALSRYSYMDVGGKMVFGPAWDFDYALGSLQVRGNSKAVTDEKGQTHYADNDPRKWGHLQNDQNLLGQWTFDPYFSFKVREKYFATRGELDAIVGDGGLIDQYREKLATSAAANDLRWNNRIGFAGSADEEGDVDVMKRFFREHVAWLDAQFATVGDAVVNATTTGYNAKLHYKRNAQMTVSIPEAPTRADSVEKDVTDVELTYRPDEPLAVSVSVPDATAARVVLSVNGLACQTADVVSGAAAFALPFSAFKRGATNLLAVDAVDGAGKTLSRNVALFTCLRRGGVIFLQ